MTDRYFTGNKDAEKLIDLAKLYFNRGAHVLEPFAGSLNLIWADRSLHFRWTTNDIVKNRFLDLNLDYRDIPVKKYDLVITNPPFNGGIKNLIDILNHLGKYTNDIFCVVFAAHLRKRDLQKIFDNKWLMLENVPSTNSFWSEAENRNKCIRCRIVHFQKSSLMIRHLSTNPKIVEVKNNEEAEFHVSEMATCVGHFVHRLYPFKKLSFNIEDEGLREFTQKNQKKIGDLMHRYAKEYSANMYKIYFYEINHFVTSFYFASRFENLKEAIPLLKIVTMN